ncbi:MAG: hypothetical protein KA132_08815, partial [Thauera sp.]|nr:hypothetical protein [Thauera sp.]
MKHDARTQAAIDAGHPEWAELLATRKEAATIAVTRYFTGKPCKHGHISARWSHGGNCAVCDEARRNQPEVKARVYALQKAYDQARKHEPKVVENRRAW